MAIKELKTSYLRSNINTTYTILRLKAVIKLIYNQHQNNIDNTYSISMK